MNRIEEGKVYTAVRQRTGSSASGDWELLATRDERGSNDIALFVLNRPSNVPEGGRFRVDKIKSISLGNRKDNNGNWRATVSVDAYVTAVISYEEYRDSVSAGGDTADSQDNPASNFSQLQDDEDSLPF